MIEEVSKLILKRDTILITPGDIMNKITQIFSFHDTPKPLSVDNTETFFPTTKPDLQK